MKVTALIPAYNEAKTISSVIETLRKNEKINDILVIDDGSSDNTADLARLAGAKVISFKTNQGKGAALQKGIEEINSEIIIMLDGDLIGLRSIHIDNLLKPLLNEEVDMTVGVFNEGRGLTDLAQLVTPNLSGQRAVKKAVLKDLTNLRNAGYGVEIALNKYVRKNGRLKFVELPELTHLMKEEKRGFTQGIVDRGKMYWDILKVLIKSSVKM